MENNDTIDFAKIKGWGVDADPRNDPTYPMKKRNDAEQEGYSWDRPPQQESESEPLRSTERPNTSAVFGAGPPPSGLSGLIRRYAFRYSESSYRHWVPLLLADRVNMVEGVIDDLARGKIPNVFAEMGWRADWKHDRRRLVTKCAIGVALAAAVTVYASDRRRRRAASHAASLLKG
jgi:hypothetical protein